MNTGISLRPLTNTDGPALAGLSYSSPDNGRIRYAANYKVDAVQAMQALHGSMEGVAACSVGMRMVGFALVRYGQCYLQDEVRPYALLGNLIVHPDFRGKGLASQLVEWQIEKARERVGEEGVLLANFQRGNQASRRLFSRWQERMVSPLLYYPQAMLTDAPPTPPGLIAGPLDSAEYASFAEQLNAFYKDWNFHQPASVDSLSELFNRSPVNAPFRHPYTVVDASGALLAGLVVMEEFRLKEMEIHALPSSQRLLNRVLRFIPPNGAMRQLYIDHLWYRPGQAQAARHLIDTVRWIWAGRATNVSALFDERSPLAALFPTRPWSIVTRTSVALLSPHAFDPNRWIRPIY